MTSCMPQQAAVRPVVRRGRHTELRAALSRRRMLGVGLAGSGALLAGCAPADRPGGATAWSHIDARGKRIELDHRPNRIVAYSTVFGSLAGYGVRFAGVYGRHEPVDGKPNPLLGGASLAGVRSLTPPGVYLLTEPEQVLAAQPDLVLERALGDPPGPFAMTKETLAKLEPAVPVGLLDVSSDSLPGLLDDYAELARHLGGDPDSERVRAARARFESETNAIERSLASKPPFRVLIVSGTPQNALLYRADAALSMRYLAGLGMQLIDPGERAADNFFVQTSWEDFGGVEADVIGYDARPGSKALRQLMTIPTFRNHPAVRAGQVVPQLLEQPLSYLYWAAELGRVADWTDRFGKL